MATQVSTSLPQITNLGRPMGIPKAGEDESLTEDGAVVIRNLTRWYGKSQVLFGVNMTVRRGTIYGLLGPSGAGKTTLLTTIVGNLRPHGGTVRVLDGRPGIDSISVPGRNIGLMPQDLALYPDLTIQESLYMFGGLYGLRKATIQYQMEVLLDFLDLPSPSRLVKNLSGGQMRRVSLACALIHQPPLLLLDEPTVGADPVLRARIWDYLVQLAQEGTTIIVTTHYIEEAKGADRIGLMRRGRILVEGNPKHVLETTGTTSLEDAFLQLCNLQDGVPMEGKDHSQWAYKSPIDPGAASRTPWPGKSEVEKEPFFNANSYRIRLSVVWALILKLWHMYKRNPLLLMFMWGVPAAQMVLFCVAIGRPPRGLNFGIVNLDQPKLDGPHWGQHYAEKLQRDPLYNIKYYNNSDDARLEITDGQMNRLFGLIEIGPHFSDTLTERLIPFNPFKPPFRPRSEEQQREINWQSSLNMTLDMSDYQKVVVIQNSTTMAYLELVEDLLTHKGLKPSQIESIQPAIQINHPLYGSDTSQFSDFVAPGIIIAIAFAQSIGLTALSFLMEKKENTLPRLWSAGVTPAEVLFGTICTQGIILCIQTAMIMSIASGVFDVPLHESIILIVMLVLLMGFCGMTYGLIIATLSNSETQALQIAMGSLFPSLLLSGVIWPVESTPDYLKWICYFLPTMWGAEAMRSLCLRGWEFTTFSVWMGFLVPSLYMIVGLIWSTINLKSRV